MSRHRKVKALDYDEEYDDYYGEYDDEDDINEDAFQAKYLNTGIDLNIGESSNISNTKDKQQRLFDEIQNTTNDNLTNLESLEEKKQSKVHEDASSTSQKQETFTSNLTSDLARIAIQHLDKNQWQLPLLEMDKRFRDRTYYKHYTDTYITSLRSKLGHFLTDNQLVSNPMKYHVQKELDNYNRYSRMTELLVEYYQSLGSGFFSFATPSPDEEIVIGCRLGTKVKKQVPKPNVAKPKDEPKPARFEFQGKGASANKQSNSSKAVNKPPAKQMQASKSKSSELTIRENHTVEQLDTLTKKYKESLKIEAAKTKAIVKTTKKQDTDKTTEPTTSTKPTTQKDTKSTNVKQPNNQAKQLETLAEKRQKLKNKLKRDALPSPQDIEAFKKQALQTTREYDELVKSTRPRVNLVVVGHVDSGKSTLVGHLLYKLGQVSSKQMHRNEVDSQRSGKASFKFAWALDETSEERARGVTIDIALTKFETARKDVVLLDAPGHVDFIPAVISGAAQADAALLVVDATRGEFETGFSNGGQTREHTFLVRSLGVKSLVVVVNKMDNVDWSFERYRDICDQLKPFLKQVGFNLNEDVQFVICSGLTGDNLTERRVDVLRKQSSHPQMESELVFYESMPSLLEAIDKIKQPERMVDKPTRVCITDVFKGMSSGVFLGGKVISGKIESKQKMILLPPNENCEIKSVEVRDSKETRAFAGEIVTTVATGIDMMKYYRGAVLCDPLIPCQVTNRFQVRIIMFQNANTILIRGTPIEVHINGTYESGEVRKLVSLLNKNSGELIQKKPRCIASNSSAIIQLKLDRVVCCELYEDNKDLGRLMLRSYGKTIAAGLITKIKRAKVGKNRTKMKSKK